MTWAKNLDFTAADILTAAELNHLADNLEETAPAKAVNVASYFVGTGPNSIGERRAELDVQNSNGTTTSSRWGDVIPGDNPAPEIADMLTGPSALVCVAARTSIDTVGAIGRVGYEISGATNKDPQNNRALVHEAGAANYQQRSALIVFDDRLTPGHNTFTTKYKTTAGTFTVANRRMAVVPF